MTEPTTTQEAPWASMMFAAGSVAIDADNDIDASKIPAEKPIRIVARTGGEAYQEYWGRCVHDMAGFIPPKGSVNLDYAHKPDESIGVATVKIVNGELIADGRLIPFKPNDQASEVIFKGSKGIPFQASIVMNPATCEVRKVRDGETVNVNGGKFSGPGAIFTRWGIDGIAILPYGSDPSTSVEFARGKPDIQVSVQTPIEKEAPMTDPVITPPITPPVAPVIEPVANPDNFSRAACLQFKTDFGPAGQDWYLEGKTYSEAAKLFGADLQAKLDEANTKLAAQATELATVIADRDAFKAKSEFKRGQAAPVPGKPTEGEPEKKKADLADFGRPQYAALAKSIEARMPKN